jgi:hypothetical protein
MAIALFAIRMGKILLDDESASLPFLFYKTARSPGAIGFLA